ncbi:GlsB/YeaQ/YmgE family stress response membrane protein [Lederbergia sp. NSJ-179]|uniref:GlsB/YeaQ/YmgE family stress response membrane protein n=1 Tax=Lederbergia sp. NSJ-179 TaxID=2931402 RepID=UPI001FD296A6|nr:GlsB/YeaQ/YmgE family stress response membrane protein [Lederbergia sp. NSJ-179]MCJ7841246.1 GlsB/YeaQ/YmgE family stress response membrane protein [Lederbergia sp. NSJ-179]
MTFLLYLIIGGIIGWIASLILGKDVPGGIIGNIIAGIVGAWIGGALFGDWGPQLAGMAIIPALIGSLILVFVLSLILGAVARGKNNT